VNAALRLLLSLAIAVLLLALLFLWGGASCADLRGTLARLPAGTWFSALAIHAGIYLLRAARFRVLIPPRHRPPLARVLGISAAHNLAAYVLPAKTGEAALVLYLKGACAVPAREGLATLVVSRLLDLATLAGGLGIACLAMRWLVPLGALLLALAALFGLLCLRPAALVRVPTVLTRLARLERTRAGARVEARAAEAAAALSAAGGAGRLPAAALLSLPLWLGVFLFYAVLARGLGLSESVELARATFGSGLAVAANLLPINGLAGFGTQEAGWVVGFGALGVSRELALSSGLGAHLVQLANVAAFGLLGHLAMGLARRRPAPRTS